MVVIIININLYEKKLIGEMELLKKNGGAGAARKKQKSRSRLKKKMRSRSRLKKNEEPEPKKKFAGFFLNIHIFDLYGEGGPQILY